MASDATKQTDDQILSRIVKIITSHNADYDDQPDEEKGSDAATDRDLSAYDAITDVLIQTGRLNQLIPLDVACPTCKQPPGLRCVGDILAQTPRNAAAGWNDTHAARIAAAKRYAKKVVRRG